MAHLSALYRYLLCTHFYITRVCTLPLTGFPGFESTRRRGRRCAGGRAPLRPEGSGRCTCVGPCQWRCRRCLRSAPLGPTPTSRGTCPPPLQAHVLSNTRTIPSGYQRYTMSYVPVRAPGLGRQALVLDVCNYLGWPRRGNVVRRPGAPRSAASSWRGGRG